MEGKLNLTARVTALEIAVLALIENSAKPQEILQTIDRIAYNTRQAGESDAFVDALRAEMEQYKEKCRLML